MPTPTSDRNGRHLSGIAAALSQPSGAARPRPRPARFRTNRSRIASPITPKRKLSTKTASNGVDHQAPAAQTRRAARAWRPAVSSARWTPNDWPSCSWAGAERDQGVARRRPEALAGAVDCDQRPRSRPTLPAASSASLLTAEIAYPGRLTSCGASSSVGEEAACEGAGRRFRPGRCRRRPRRRRGAGRAERSGRAAGSVTTISDEMSVKKSTRPIRRTFRLTFGRLKPRSSTSREFSI